MSIERGSDGRWTVRREFRRTVGTEAEAKRLDSLCRNAHDKVWSDFHIGLSSCPTIREALPEYLNYKRIERANEPATLRVIKKRLERFALDLSRGAGDIAVDRILVTDLVEWRRKRLTEGGRSSRFKESKTVARDVVNAEVSALKAFANWCVMKGWCRAELEIFKIDWLAIKGKDGGRQVPRGMGVPRYKLITNALRKRYGHIELVLRAMVLTGARPAALFALRWQDVEWPKSMMPGRVRFRALKGGVETEMQISNQGQVWRMFKEAVTLLMARGHRIRGLGRVFVSSRGQGWTSAGFGHALAWAQKKLDIPNPITAYYVRHAAITWLMQAGMGQASIQAFAKHRSVGSQSVYRHVAGGDAVGAYQYLDSVIGGHKVQGNGEPENRMGELEDEIEVTEDMARRYG